MEVPSEEEDEEEEFEDEGGELELIAEAAEVLPDGSEEEEGIKAFGNDENISEIEKRLSKLILCVEMQNWERAEMFADSVKQLVDNAPKDIRTTTLHLKMDVQKENYDKVAEDYGQLLKYLSNFVKKIILLRKRWLCA